MNMKKTVTRVLALLVMVCIFASFVSVGAKAADTSGKRYNIMLVIDGSGSLKTTDKLGMRYELIGDLLGVLENNGHNVGAMVFSGNSGWQTTPEAMESGFLLRPFMLSLDKMAPDGKPPKDYILNAIQDAGVDNSMIGCTDIGTALLAAERQLQQMQQENGLESLIFLFSDGITEFYYNGKDVFPLSEQNRVTATREMQENGIRLFGAFLQESSYDGSGAHYRSEASVKDIVCAANGIGEYSEEFQISYVELRSASDAHRAVDVVMKFLGIGGGNPIRITDSFEDTFMIPGVGVESMTIRLYSEGGEDLPDVKVSFVSPDGSVLQGAGLMSVASRTYRQYRIEYPRSGLWTVKIILPQGENAVLYYDPFISLSIEAGVIANPGFDALHVNMDADFTAMLMQNGEQMQDPNVYSGYTCTMELRSESTGVITPYTIPMEGVSPRTLSTFLSEYGSFSIRPIFRCGEKIVVTGDFVTFTLENEAPNCGVIPGIRLKTGPFQESSHTVDISEYVNDREDGKNLTYRVVANSGKEDGYRLDGSVLTLYNGKIGNCRMVIEVVDQYGGVGQLAVNVSVINVTVAFVIGLLIALLVIAVIAFLIKRFLTTRRPKGALTAAFELSGGRYVTLPLDLPGNGTTSKTNLADLILSAVDGPQASFGGGFNGTAVKAELQDEIGALKKVKISAATKRTKKGIVGAVKVKDTKGSSVLYGDSREVMIGSRSYMVSYAAEDEDGAPNPFGPAGPLPNSGFGSFSGGSNGFGPFGGNGGQDLFGGNGGFDFGATGGTPVNGPVNGGSANSADPFGGNANPADPANGGFDFGGNGGNDGFGFGGNGGNSGFDFGAAPSAPKAPGNNGGSAGSGFPFGGAGDDIDFL